MHSQEKKIKRLLESKDPENQKIAQLTLMATLNTENVLYWVLTLDPLNNKMKFEEGLFDKMSELVGWSTLSPAIENLSKMVQFIQINRPSVASVEKFFEFYNEYLYNLMSFTWQSEDRIALKSQIPQLNVSTTPTKSN